MWPLVVAFFVVLVAGLVLAPKPKTRGPGIGEVQAPTAEDGREIPVLFGTRILKGPNVVWYGDIDTDAIKKKAGK